MPSQSDTQKVVFNVIEPMKRHWAAEFDADTISDFVDDLHKFSAESLKNAMADMRREHKRKPSLSHIFEACRQHEPAKRSSQKNKAKYPWEGRDEQKNKMISDYISQFKNISTIWNEAVREGWDIDLWRYVSSVASVQAQMIVGDKNIGWDGVVIFGVNTFITDEMRYLMMRDQRKQADTGSIDVAIPTGRIGEWKHNAAWKKEQQKSTQEPGKTKPEIAKKIINPGLDQYIEMLRA